MILSEFQLKAIENIKKGNHVLVTAHTGSGKTLPAEFAIDYFINKGKKVIYTSPIKALSNQKYLDFSKKYKNIGILTGDIKHNPSANILIMTTEILQNQLFKLESKDKLKSFLDFDIDIKNDLGCVIFDEVHYINDMDRGTIWENTIMLLPNNVQFVMLSATIGNPEIFSKWISKIKEKEVAICSTSTRVVPLVIYNYFISPQSVIDKITNKDERLLLNKNNDKLSIVKENIINEDSIHTTNKCLKILNTNYSKTIYVINELCRNLKEREMFPALFFVFSRKKVEQIAKGIHVSLFEKGEKDYQISSVCKQLLVSKLTNWKEYYSLPEYKIYIDLLEKGIGYHHAGMLPIFREMMEVLYEQKYIKVLISTETFAIGLNMPTKTVCFTSIFKHDGNSLRKLYNYEFIQMAGRAGRRNIDTIGHVILLPNLYERLTYTEYCELLCSKPQNIKSKFRIDYNIVLHFLSSGKNKNDIINYINNSFMKTDIDNEINSINQNIMEYKSNIVEKEKVVLNKQKIEEYMNLKNKIYNLKPNQRKKYQRQFNDYNVNENELKLYNELIEYKKELLKEENYKIYSENYIKTQVENIVYILENNAYIQNNELTNKGKMACMMHEINPFLFCDLYEETNGFINYSGSEIISLFSCFYDSNNENTTNTYFDNEIKQIQSIINKYKEEETKYNLYLTNVTIQTNMIFYIKEWIENCHDIESSNIFLNKFKKETDLFIGEFIKCCLKLIHISNEIKSICEYFNNYELLTKIDTTVIKIMKFIITNNSLYL